MTKFEEEFNYLIELSGKVLIGQVDAETFEKNRIAFFEKYETDQQQALPVVPEEVTEWISEDIENNTVVEDILTIIITSDDKDLKEYGLWIKKNPVTYVIARTLGYTVEKPQLFYLKHIDFCKTDKHYDWFTIKHSDGPLNHLRVEKGQKPSTIDCKFTQQEIDSMQTGSYEQIEVAE
ncbi:DUF1642 domain-containing protein [Lactococcus lactis]|uniref:DUF1642 domain-containing protein n=1 Tax=Lactococcus lactis subsp. lactis TaxID=1360 RepID=A0AAF0VYY5_LACLL|nr:DUF1642 domain-containing protein [Lactococcus lactis]ARE09508.1 DUF1642 domain-containing protein [Lactococcus lactis subsp. lactis]MRK42616.1 DUF1642 domain-containing protein [Lactococcus lactis subsp. lactis]WNS48355.1 DUF1642 domain-containing protein [Lactococcus lactis subsp. lactis]